MESSAEPMWRYDHQLIRGLLQTEESARAIATASLVYGTREQQDQVVQARLNRQEVLSREQPLQLWVIVSEAALRQSVGGPSVMRTQLRRLGEVSAELPNVTVQVLPF